MLDLPLHYGRAPRWLFERMRKLSRVIIETIIEEFGKEEVLKRLSEPGWFQSLGCLLGFDWHSSGLTTTTCAAIKYALRDIGEKVGLFAAGGKGKYSRKIPEELKIIGYKTGVNADKMIYASRLSAKVDSSAIQDGYQVYHQLFLCSEDGKWVCIDQGMNERTGWARRYHWFSENLSSFVEEPHKGVAGVKEKDVLNLVAKGSRETRKCSLELIQKPEEVIKEIKRLPKRHRIIERFDVKRMERILLKIYEQAPEKYEHLLSIEGVGAKTLRALALTSEIIYGAIPSYDDPVSFSYAHGGKDGHPYPVQRDVYENTILIFERALKKAKLGKREELKILKKIPELIRPT